MTPAQPIILDLDGTVHYSGQPIPGTAEAISKLRRQGHPLVYVTNALESRATYAAQLNQLGVPAQASQIITAPLVLAQYLRRQMPGATLFVISDPPLAENLSAQFDLSQDPTKIDAVVVSCDQEFDARKINIAFQALRRGARFFAINADPTCPVPGGAIPDAGAVIGALEGCSQRQVELVAGKPSALMTETILQKVNRPAAECWMVGDSLHTDILMGQRAGMTTTLVLTGVTRRADLARSCIQPHHILESLAALPDLLDHQRTKRS